MEQLTMKHAAAFTRGINTGDRSVDATVSSEAIDRMGEIIDQGTWRLADFERNPVVLWQHDHDQPIGRASRLNVRGSALEARIHFSTTARGEEAWQLFQDGALRAFSVGFRAGRVAVERVDNLEVVRLLDCELMEISAVSVPANPEALVKHKSLGLVPSRRVAAGEGSLAIHEAAMATVAPRLRGAATIHGTALAAANRTAGGSPSPVGDTIHDVALAAARAVSADDPEAA